MRYPDGRLVLRKGELLPRTWAKPNAGETVTVLAWAFASENGIALADATRRLGHLWREGIPFSTMDVNDVNHHVPSA